MKEVWNREELYAEVWEQPAIKVAVKYGISAVMLGKVCRKLLVPVPGRGYWAKKEFGKPVRRLPLPAAKNIPTLYRSTDPSEPATPKVQAPEPTDAEYLRIVEVESRALALNPDAPPHKLVAVTRRWLEHAKAGDRGLLEPRYDHPCLDVRVSPSALDRALGVMNAIILALESEGFPVTLRPGRHGTGAQILGHRVSFAIVEKMRETGRREVKEPWGTRTVMDYEATGKLEFRVGDYNMGQRVRDGKVDRLEDLLSKCLGMLLREGRACIIQAEYNKQREIERQEEAEQRCELARLVSEEEKKVHDLEGWVDQWKRAREMRDLIR